MLALLQLVDSRAVEDWPQADYAHVSPHALEYFNVEECCQ